MLLPSVRKLAANSSNQLHLLGTISVRLSLQARHPTAAAVHTRVNGSVQLVCWCCDRVQLDLVLVARCLVYVCWRLNQVPVQLSGTW